MKLILFRGRPGTGKTTLSTELSISMNSPVLRKDDIYDVVAESVSSHETRNKISYGALYKLLESNVSSDAVFILDYPFQHEGDLDVLKDWCNKKGVELKSILVTCSDESLWAERFNKRKISPAPNQLITDFETLKKHYGTMQLTKESGELLVDTSNDIESLLKDILSFI